MPGPQQTHCNGFVANMEPFQEFGVQGQILIKTRGHI